MKKIQEITEYKIIAEDINFANDNLLNFLYLPIIGSASYQMYAWFKAEAMIGLSNNENIIQVHQRILNYLQVNLAQFNEIRINLESYGLLKTYYDETNDLYIYNVLKPLEVDKFCENLVFRNKLIETISKEEFEKTLMFLSPIKLNEIFEDISVEIHNNFVANKKENTIKLANYQFDFTKLIADFAKENIILKLDEESHNLIETFFKTKLFSYELIKGNIENALIKDEKKNYSLNLSLFNELMKISQFDLEADNTISKIKSNEDEVLVDVSAADVRTVDLFLDFNFDSSKEEKILKFYGQHNFLEFFRIVIKDKPSAYTLKNINELENKYHFNNLIFNLLCDFVIFETGRLNLTYLKKLCQTINNLNLQSEEKILEHLRNFKKRNKFNHKTSAKNFDVLETKNDKKEVNENYFNFLND